MEAISLEGMEFFARHGYYDEERKMGARYGVDISVEANVEEAADKDDLTETVDYEKLYSLIRQVMEKPSRLLENVARRIIDRVFAEFAQVQRVRVSVSKYNPPVGGICERARVTLAKKRNEP